MPYQVSQIRPEPVWTWKAVVIRDLGKIFSHHAVFAWAHACRLTYLGTLFKALLGFLEYYATSAALRGDFSDLSYINIDIHRGLLPPSFTV